MIHIRKATTKDQEDIQFLAEEGKSPEYFQRIIESGICFVAEIDIEGLTTDMMIIGTVYGEKNVAENWTELRGIMVVPEWRGKGVGTRLLKAFLKEAVGEVEVFYKGDCHILPKLGFTFTGNYNLWTKENK